MRDQGFAQSRTIARRRIPYRVPHAHCWNAPARFLRAFNASFFAYAALQRHETEPCEYDEYD